MRSLVRLGLTVAATACLFAAASNAAQAKVQIAVDLDTQTMHFEAGGRSYDWKVSSGKPGYETPAGNFHVLWMDKDHHSDEYDQAYMPNAIFFAPGYAIHGYGKSPWGHKASHGCIRIPVAKSALLFGLVQKEGAEVTITGYSPTVAPTVASVNAARAAQRADDEPLENAPPPGGSGADEAPVTARPGSPMLGGFY